MLLHVTLHNADKGFHTENRSQYETYLVEYIINQLEVLLFISFSNKILYFQFIDNIIAVFRHMPKRNENIMSLLGDGDPAKASE